MNSIKSAAVPDPDLGHLLDIAAVADRLDVCQRTVRRLISRGDLRAHRIGRLLRVSQDELDRFLDSSSLW